MQEGQPIKNDGRNIFLVPGAQKLHSSCIPAIINQQMIIMLQKISFPKSLVLACVLAGFSLSSCDKDDDNDNQKVNYNLTATMNGAKEVPAVTTTATGSLTGTYNKNTNALSYTVNWTGLSGAAGGMHFHGPASTTESAGVALGVTGFPAEMAGTHSGTATLTDAQETELLGGKWYFNIHTPDHQAGEIRGQVEVQ